MEQNQVYTPTRTYTLSHPVTKFLLLFYRFEALTSVDMSGKSKQGERFQQAYAFRSFHDAVVSQMLNDHPTAAIHDYNPRDNAQESEALRAVLLGIADEPPAKAESPQPPELPHNVPERQSTPPPEPVSAPSTPQRSRSAPSHTENIPGSFNIFFSPNVAVRVNSPGINAPGTQHALLIVIKLTAEVSDRSSPVPSTPSRGSQAREGITRGRRTLLAEEFTMDQVLSVEAMLMTCLSGEDFAEGVHDEFGMKKLRALDVWETYKGR